MRKLLVLGLLVVGLSSCSMFQIHRVEVDQGDYMTPAMVNRLHPGMTVGQVKAVMGAPVMVNVMNPRVESYVYTSQIGSAPRLEKKVTLVFNRGVLEGIQREGI